MARDVDVALVTAPHLPELIEDDRLLVPALADVGLRARAVVWDARWQDWGDFRAAVVRSVRDVHQRRDAFVAWAQQVAKRTLLLNPAPVLRWSTHKGYLRELERAGVPVTPTAWVERGARADLAALAHARGWTGRLVVKPSVSAGAAGVHRVDPAVPGALAAGQAALDALSARGVALVQPYLDDLEARGERAYVFLGGALSHAVARPPGLAGVPRAFTEAHAVAPDPAELALAEAAREALRARELLYLRVDVATGADGAPRLQEVEATEPQLFLRLHPDAPGRLARALAARL